MVSSNSSLSHHHGYTQTHDRKDGGIVLRLSSRYENQLLMENSQVADLAHLPAWARFRHGKSPALFQFAFFKGNKTKR
jgi:hypothetical protein